MQWHVHNFSSSRSCLCISLFLLSRPGNEIVYVFYDFFSSSSFVSCLPLCHFLRRRIQETQRKKSKKKKTKSWNTFFPLLLWHCLKISFTCQPLRKRNNLYIRWNSQFKSMSNTNTEQEMGENEWSMIPMTMMWIFDDILIHSNAYGCRPMERNYNISCMHITSHFFFSLHLFMLFLCPSKCVKMWKKKKKF